VFSTYVPGLIKGTQYGFYLVMLMYVTRSARIQHVISSLIFTLYENDEIFMKIKPIIVLNTCYTMKVLKPKKNYGSTVFLKLEEFKNSAPPRKQKI